METFFVTINDWMTGTMAFAVLGSLLWGMVSVLFSPCHLASIPLMVAYVAGQEKAVNPEAGHRLFGRLFHRALHHHRR